MSRACGIARAAGIIASNVYAIQLHHGGYGVMTYLVALSDFQ